mmetsp:Transcript_34976/g.96729  ORF Transcript_34976/g.96729 Transcript_34976/m.96729 type:complete len:285 (+) Transcript_34976:658-1512(+)
MVGCRPTEPPCGRYLASLQGFEKCWLMHSNSSATMARGSLCTLPQPPTAALLMLRRNVSLWNGTCLESPRTHTRHSLAAWLQLRARGLRWPPRTLTLLSLMISRPPRLLQLRVPMPSPPPPGVARPRMRRMMQVAPRPSQRRPLRRVRALLGLWSFRLLSSLRRLACSSAPRSRMGRRSQGNRRLGPRRSARAGLLALRLRWALVGNRPQQRQPRAAMPWFQPETRRPATETGGGTLSAESSTLSARGCSCSSPRSLGPELAKLRCPRASTRYGPGLMVALLCA